MKSTWASLAALEQRDVAWRVIPDPGAWPATHVGLSLMMAGGFVSQPNHAVDARARPIFLPLPEAAPDCLMLSAVRPSLLCAES